MSEPIVWRYLPGSQVKHALTDPSDERAVCGVSALSPPLWMGTGSQREYETAACLRGCRHCVARVGEPNAAADAPGGERCEPLTDDSGQVIARVRVSGDLGEDGQRALREIVAAAHRLHDANPDPERDARYAAGQERIRERNRRLHGGEP